MTARSVPHRWRASNNASNRLHELEHARTHASTEIEDVDPALPRQHFAGQQMRLREVFHVNIIPNRTTVGRRIIRSEDREGSVPIARSFDHERNGMGLRLVTLHQSPHRDHNPPR